jgi:hypothetical protein
MNLKYTPCTNCFYVIAGCRWPAAQISENVKSQLE